MKSIISLLEKYSQESPIDYHIYFRNRSLKLKKKIQDGSFSLNQAVKFSEKNLVSHDLCYFVEKNIAQISNHIFEILLSPHSAKILFNLYCCSAQNNHSLFSKLSPTLANILFHIRGEPNLYKLNGWMVHVLIGYSIVTQYLPKGELPPTLNWSYKIRVFIKKNLQTIYQSLKKSDIAILHASMLGHDIGVATNIEDHDKYGVSIVPIFLKEINISETTLINQHINMSYDDFLWAVQLLVRHHTFINRVGIEYSHNRSKKELDNLSKEAQFNIWREKFLKESFIPLLFLMATGDLIAVDDALLTEAKAQIMLKAYNTLVALSKKKIPVLDNESEGFSRFKNFLNVKNNGIEKQDLEKEIMRFGFSPNDFWNKFYLIDEFNFALSLVPFLPTALDILFVFLTLFEFIDNGFGNSASIYTNTRIVFSHRISPELFSDQIRRLRASFSEKKASFSIQGKRWNLEKLVLELITDTDGHLVTVKYIE